MLPCTVDSRYNNICCLIFYVLKKFLAADQSVNLLHKGLQNNIFLYNNIFWSIVIARTDCTLLPRVWCSKIYFTYWSKKESSSFRLSFSPTDINLYGATLLCLKGGRKNRNGCQRKSYVVFFVSFRSKNAKKSFSDQGSFLAQLREGNYIT